MARYDNEWDHDRDRGRDQDREERDRRHDRERELGRRNSGSDYGSHAGWGGQGFNQGSFGNYGGQGERLYNQHGGQGFGAEHGYTGRETGGGMSTYNAEGRGGAGWGGASDDPTRGNESHRRSERWGSQGGYGQGSEGGRGRDRADEWRNRGDDRNREDWGRDWGGQGFSGREGGWGGYGSYDRERRTNRGSGSSGFNEQWRGDERRNESRPAGGYGEDWRSRSSQGWVGGQSMGQQQDWSRSGGQFAGRGPKGYKRSDERIREDLNERLTDHPDVDASEIEVDVKDGVVTLRGTVDERRTKHLVEDLAERVSGVRDVHNEIRVNRGFWGSIKDAFTGESDEDVNRRDRSGQPETTTGDRVSTTSTHTVTPTPESEKVRY